MSPYDPDSIPPEKRRAPWGAVGRSVRLRMSEELADAIEKRAAEEQLSIVEWMRRALQTAVEARPKRKGRV